MEDLRRYVLYSRKQEEAFRNRYANVIAARRRAVPGRLAVPLRT